ncbi:MAG: type I polyketide synthase, partial [Stackebrandtia sp.]
VLKSTAVNNDGRDKIGYTAPSQSRQAAVIRVAHEKAGIDPATVTYVEAHGTGTALGDPIEVAALREAFGDGVSRSRSERYSGDGAGRSRSEMHSGDGASRRALGSVKTNIGHLDVASGIAGLVKAVLCLENRALPPTLHYTAPNPRLELDESGFYVNAELAPWNSEQGPLRAGVSSFGIGGTNAHAVLEEAPASPPPDRETPARSSRPLVVSAQTPEALHAQSRSLARHLEDNPNVAVARAAYTLHSTRRRFDCGRVVVADDRAELVDRLRGDEPAPVARIRRRPTVFLFPGQGAQYQNMGLRLYRDEPGFRAHVDRCLHALRPHLSGDVAEADLLGRTEAVGDTRYTQTALFVLEYSLAQWMRDLGVEPATMIGHSLGEYTAACLAGVFSLGDALWLVRERGRLLASTPPGAMLAVPLPASRTEPEARRHGLDVAVIDDAASCVASGTPEAVDALEAELKADGVAARRVAVSRAFHSRLLDPVADDFADVLARIDMREPTLPFVSNLTGDWADPRQVCRPEYWTTQLRSPVQFHQGLSTLFGDELSRDAVCLEVGPGRHLARLVRRHSDSGERIVAPTLPRADQAEQETRTALTALGTVWAAGGDVDAEAFHGMTSRDRVRLPGYAFARSEHWIERPGGAEPASPPSETPPAAARAEPVDGPADDATAVVVEAWTTVLGVRRVGPDDDFFEQGGDSLAAVQLVARVQERTGVRVEFMELERHTPRSVAEHLARRREDRSSSEDSARPVVVKRGDPASARPPLILVHPIGGDVYFYRELAACLPEDQAVCAIRSPMLDGAAEFDSVEEMAASYLEQLENFGLKPPYRLGGSSFGGIVAFHMAQLLDERDGYRPQVALIDSPAHGGLPADMTDKEIVDYLFRYGLARLDFPMSRLEAIDTFEEKIRFVADRARGTEFETILSADFLPRLVRVWQRHSRAMHAYVPQPYAGEILYFSHQEEIPEFPPNPQRRWRELAHGGWTHVSVPGNHLSMNGMPHVAVIGARLGAADVESPTKRAHDE